MKYDYLVVGAGLFGAVCAHELTKAGKKCLVIDRRNHIGGNVYTEKIEGIQVHKYGAHIFHTLDKRIWDYISQFAEFNHYRHTVVANYNGEMYNLPFNMNTFNRIWGVVTPDEAKGKIDSQRFIGGPRNLEEQALSLVGRDVYEKLVKDYTEKQWGRQCAELSVDIIKRLPVRYTYCNDYFDDPYQGIPIGGYTRLFERMLVGIEVKLGIDYISNRDELNEIAEKTIYTGMIDEYYNYAYGELEYRSLRFETETIDSCNYQGCAVCNYTDRTPYTRIIEHKHFDFNNQDKTVITREYPQEWNRSSEAYYPVNTEKNTEKYNQYQRLAENDSSVIFGGRLGLYRYMDMDKTFEAALSIVSKLKY
jgi:UDP-galactopyranose mutase